MLGQQIDYAALAKQAGAITPSGPPPPPAPTTAPVDYAALARQAGAIQPTTGGGRGAGPGTVGAARSGAPMRASGPGSASGSHTAPPPAPPFDWRSAAEDVGGTLGATAATALAPEFALPAWAARTYAVAKPIVGAAVGGGVTGAAVGDNPLTVAGTQAAYDAGGQLVSWPLKAAGRRLIASKVGRYAKQALESGRAAVTEQFDRVLAQAEAAIRGNRQGLSRAVASQTGAVQGAEAGVRDAVDTVRTVKAMGAADVEQAAARWPGGPPPPAPTQQVADVLQGPAQHSLDRLGKAVDAAAETGPTIPWEPIQAKLNAMAGKIDPKVLHATDIGAVATPAGMVNAGQINPANLQRMKPDDIRDYLATVGIPLEESHPLPGVLGKIMSVQQDTIPFADAHRFKRLLDEAVNWESPAKKQVQQITKGIRNTLRESMATHTPYNQATAAYASARPFFTEGYGKKATKLAVGDPEGWVPLVSNTQKPTRIQMLKDVLTQHAAAGGGPTGAAAGQEAWNSVRAAVTHAKFIQPGIEKFESTLTKAHPEWVNALYGDADGRVVLDNLRQISQAWRQAQGAADRLTAAATQGVRTARGGAQAAKDALTATRTAGAVRTADLASTKSQIAAQVRALKPPTAVEQRFAQSSLAAPPSPAQAATDLAHMAIPGHSVFKLASASRLWLKGPRVDDLIEWAAYSPKGTQLLVQALTGPAPGMALAVLARKANLQGSANPTEEELQPVPAHGAAPPPGPRVGSGPPPSR